MLVLNLSVDERVRIDGGITVCLTKIKGARSAAIGFEAPPEVNIVRQEVLDRLDRLEGAPNRRDTDGP